MKKCLAMLLVLVMLIPAIPAKAAGISIISNGKTGTYEAVKVKVNGKLVNTKDAHGFLENGNALVPYKDIFETALKIKTAYSSKTKTISFSYNNHKVVLTMGSTTAVVDGVKKVIPSVPKIVEYKQSKAKKVVVPIKFVATSLGLGYKWSAESKTIELTKPNKGFEINYNGKTITYEDAPVNIVVDKTKLKTAMPGLKIGNNILVPAAATFARSSIEASYNIDKKTGDKLTMKKGKNSIELTLGTKKVKVNGKSKTMPYSSYIVKHVEQNQSYIMVPAAYVSEALGYDYKWDKKTSTVTLTEKKTPEAPSTEAPEKPPTTEAPSSGSPSSPSTNPPTNTTKELKAMWISFLEIKETAKTEAEFKALIDKMYDDSVDLGMNSVLVQVRPYADALYPSDYFPWSSFVSGTQGVSVDYDPLEYMVSAAHKRGLEFHAWINPYRVTKAIPADINGNITEEAIKQAMDSLSSDNQARIWYNSADEDENRNVLFYKNMYYFNPAKQEVRDLIINGATEIAKRYDIDGLHMDDYFYPAFTTENVSTAFDGPEYAIYKDAKEAAGEEALSIADWRRDNVNKLVKDLYSAVHNEKAKCQVGISPAGVLNNLKSDLQYYVDIDTWVNNKGYVDYLCPQIYWSFTEPTAPFDKMLDQWTEVNKKGIVDLYVGIAVYKAGDNALGEWNLRNDVLKRQIIYSRETKKVNGFMFFRYDFFYAPKAQEEIANLLPLLK